MKKELAKENMKPILFLDDWPQPPKCAHESSEEFEKGVFTEVQKWRIQTLLAVNTWGIPSLAFCKAYEKMFGKELNVNDIGFSTLADMICGLADIFTIQEPDDVTAIMFPDYPQDKILHDARLGHDFSETTEGANAALALSVGKDGSLDYKSVDPDTLIAYAWLNRDEDFPNDAVLPGEQYQELILPMTAASIPETRGVHQALIVGAANPGRFFINIRNEALAKISVLSAQVTQFFKECGNNEKYSVPEEFVFPGFPCLVYIPRDKCWERCVILARIRKTKKVRIETVDYGTYHTVHITNLYLLPRRFFDIPKQGLTVSLMGLKPPEGADKWSSKSGGRIRCFSDANYWLDFLLIEPKYEDDGKKMNNEQPSTIKSYGSPDSNNQKKSSPLSRSDILRMNNLKDKKSDYEVFVCDRHDDEMDIHLDHIMIMETYASLDEKRAQEITCIREKFVQALKSIPRPKNPFTDHKTRY